MQISISSLQTHNVNRCGRSRHLARKLSLRRKRSSPNVVEMAATETITSIILIKLIRVSLGTVRHPRRFKIVVIDIQITLKQMLRDFIFFSSRRRHTRFDCDWSSDVCSSDLSVTISASNLKTQLSAGTYGGRILFNIGSNQVNVYVTLTVEPGPKALPSPAR